MVSSRNADAWVPEAGTVLDDRYQLDRVVDRGGMGVIMRAQHIAMGREVAVKLLRPEVLSDQIALARFRREVAVAARLQHPNIVHCHDSGDTPDGGMYLVMEMLDGESLAHVLQTEGRLPLRRAAQISLQMLDGLSAAHMQGVVHRDIKPGNIFIARDSRGVETVKLLDFGLARSIFSDDVKVTQTGKICGTTAYLPPETIVSPDPTAAGDVYACGLVMLEMVLGRKVFGGADVAQSFLQHLTVAPPIPRRIWETPFGQLIAAALRKHPDERPQTAEQMYTALEQSLPMLPDLRLTDDEIPPRCGRLSGEVLQNVMGAGSLDMLRRLPPPECWGEAGAAGAAVQPVRSSSGALHAPPSAASLGQSARIPEVELPSEPDIAPLELDMSALSPSSQDLSPPLDAAPRSSWAATLVPALLGLAVIGAVVFWLLATPQEQPEREPEVQRQAPTPLLRFGSTATNNTATQEQAAKPKTRRRAKKKEKVEDKLLDKYMRVDE